MYLLNLQGVRKFRVKKSFVLYTVDFIIIITKTREQKKDFSDFTNTWIHKKIVSFVLFESFSIRCA